jgi:hypothetical protein
MQHLRRVGQFGRRTMILFGDSLFGVPLNEFLSRYGGEFFKGL